MKNIKTFNLISSRNAIGVAFVMTVLNLILVTINIIPVFSLSLIVLTRIV
jgi:hypothetical protein